MTNSKVKSLKKNKIKISTIGISQDSLTEVLFVVHIWFTITVNHKIKITIKNIGMENHT